MPISFPNFFNGTHGRGPEVKSYAVASGITMPKQVDKQKFHIVIGYTFDEFCMLYHTHFCVR